MSIVGPRPLSVRDAVRMELAWQKRRFSVKAGITCLWQVSGAATFRLNSDATGSRYIDRWSLGLDASILLRTITRHCPGARRKLSIRSPAPGFQNRVTK